MTKKNEIEITISGDAKGATDAVAKTEKSLGKLGETAKKTGDDADGIGRKFSEAFQLAAASVVAAKFIEANKSLEQLERGFTAVTGSAEAGAKAMQRATELANQLGAPVATTAQAYLDFTAAVQGSVLEGAAADAVFASVTSAMAAMGASTERTQNALLALSQMAAKGVISMEELRGQLGEALPQGLRAMADGLGLTVTQLIKLVESGKLLAEEGLPALGKALLKVGGAGGQADTFSQNWERLKNTVNAAYQTIGQGALWQGLTSALGLAAQAVGFLSIGFETLGKKAGAVLAYLAGAGTFDGLKEELRRVDEEGTKAFERLLGPIKDFDSQTKAAGQAVGDMAEKIGKGGTSFSKLGLDVETGLKSLGDFISVAGKTAQATDTATQAQQKLAEALGREDEALSLVAKAAADRLSFADKQASVDQAELAILQGKVAAYEATKEAKGSLSAASQQELENTKNLVIAKSAELEQSKANVEQAKVEAITSQAIAQAKKDGGASVESLGASYRKMADEVKRLTANELAGVEVAGAIARAQEEMAQVRERLFTASANASLGDAAWAAEVAKLSGEEARLTVELERLIDVKAAGTAATQVLGKAKELLTKREIEYRVALDAAIESSSMRIEQIQRELTLEQAQLSAQQAKAAGAQQVNTTQAETLRIQAQVQVALGNETQAQDLLTQAKQRDEAATKNQVTQLRLSAEVAKAAAEAKRAELTELERQLALKERLATVDGTVTAAEQEQIDAAKQAVEMTKAQAAELEAAARAADGYASATAEAAEANRTLSAAQEEQAETAKKLAEAKQKETEQSREWTSITAIVRQNYYALSEAAGKYFDRMMAGIKTLNDWRDALADRTFDRIKKLFDDQTASAERLSEAMQSGSLSADELAAAIARAERVVQTVGFDFNFLGEQQLSPLRAAIESAKSQLEQLHDQLNSMNEDAAAGLRSIQSEIASLQGDTVKVAAIQHQERLLGLQEKLNAAVAAGADEAVALYQQQIALEDQRYKLQLDQIQAQAGDNEAAKIRVQAEKSKVNAARDVADATKRAEAAAEATNQAAKDGEAGFKGIYDWVMGAEESSRKLADNLTALTKSPVKIPIQFTYGGNQDLLRALANALGLANRALPGGA